MLDGHKLNKRVLSSRETRHYSATQNLQLLPTGHSETNVALFEGQRQSFDSLQCGLRSQDSCFSGHDSRSNTAHIPPRAREAPTGSRCIGLLSHNNKVTLTLRKNELNHFSKKSVFTVLRVNQWKLRPILINKAHVYTIFLLLLPIYRYRQIQDLKLGRCGILLLGNS